MRASVVVAVDIASVVSERRVVLATVMGAAMRPVVWCVRTSGGCSSIAFPTAAAHGLHGRGVDLRALLIGVLERVGLRWHLVRVSPERRATKLAALPTG